MEELKKLEITLSPHIDDEYSFVSCGVTIDLEEPELKEGDRLADIWHMVAGVPGAPLTGEGLRAFDSKGEVPLNEGIEKDPTGFDKRVWRTGRETDGDVEISYRFLPRDLTGVNRCHPLFDAFQEKNGVLIPGVTTIAAVPEGRYRILQRWDRTHMPEDAGGVSIRGEGDQEYIGTPYDYTFTLYMAGKYKKAGDKAGRRFMYWLDDTLPDREKAVAQIPRLLEEICRFFRDEDLRYSIFFRKEPFDTSNSGTAFDGGFAYGYSDKMPLIMDQALNTLAHETVHNWPRMEDLGGEGTWFSEGTAEYYSVVIPARSGIIDRRRAGEWITEKCADYYNNSRQGLSCQEAYEKAWTDPECQRVPYGRGFVYLAETDRLLKEKSGGKSTVDDLVLELCRRRRDGQTVRVCDWEELIEKHLGGSSVDHFRNVMSGKETIQADDRWFDGNFTFSRGDYADPRKGLIRDAYIWTAKEENE